MEERRNIVFRTISDAMLALKDKYPILSLTGPRQSGKTTLLKNAFPEFRYVNLEKPDVRSFAETDPNGFLQQYNQNVIFDEVQNVPKLFSYLQALVDETGLMGQFVLSGSQNFSLLENISQSLAGRVALFKLFPFDNRELDSAAWLNKSNYLYNMLKGFYPSIYDRQIPTKTFYYNYIQTYIERDLVQLLNVKDLHSFKRFIGLCATRAGQLLNLSDLARDCGISQPTAKSWLSLLESSYIVFLLSPYHKNFSKRITKTPKLYFYDTGLLCYLLNIESVEQLALDSSKGNIFENMMIAEYIKQIHHNNIQQNIWFWRDVSGNEIDLLINHHRSSTIVEFKSSMTVMSNMFKGLDYFESISDISDKLLVYGGSEVQKRTNAKVIPWFDFGLIDGSN